MQAREMQAPNDRTKASIMGTLYCHLLFPIPQPELGPGDRGDAEVNSVSHSSLIPLI